MYAATARVAAKGLELHSLEASLLTRRDIPDGRIRKPISLALQGGGSHGALRAAEETVRNALYMSVSSALSSFVSSRSVLLMLAS